LNKRLILSQAILLWVYWFKAW